MSSKLKVAVLMGGRSAEREVSLSSGKQVLSSLDPDRYEAFAVDPAGWGLRSAGTAWGPVASWFDGVCPDVVFVCLHGRYGEDGRIQGLLEVLGVPYTGSGVLASALAIDKSMTKRVLDHAGIPTPPSVTLRSREQAEAFRRAYLAGEAPLRGPVAVKPNQEGSTIGLTLVREPESLAAALHTALEFDSVVLVEQLIEGIEITGPVLGNEAAEALPLVEIIPASGFFDYEAKYTPGATEEIVPARLSDELARRAQELAVQSHQHLGCRGFSRTDMLIAGDAVWVLEVNTIPGLTPTSLFPKSAAAAGISFPELLDRLIELALEGSAREPTRVISA